MKKVFFDDLIPGKEYYTECGIWKGFTTYVGSYLVGKRVKYRFTFGPADNWENQFGHFCTKSQIKVFVMESNC